ncbi:hypothetical protein K435DRAFT_863883 [Dendrothele bispora CBS 962.96]|uniref:Uncharacterized protein n=1 Tax=Dendrothele bispora (strain CBS 962.96) TaxID=1314807 RepID=A0A4S8LP78_DENBC|nr:hypothetical protein K435DRAFT_863883 [Dendrothele bispora CBS 962.96]
MPADSTVWNLALSEYEPVPSNYPSVVQRTYYFIPDIPLGQQRGVVWFTDSLKELIDAETPSSVSFWGDMFSVGAQNKRHLLVESLQVREEVRNRILRWESDEMSAFDVDTMESLEWPHVQATRCRNSRYPLPQFSGEEVQMRRVCIVRLLRECIKKLEEAEDELIEAAMFRREIMLRCEDGSDANQRRVKESR